MALPAKVFDMAPADPVQWLKKEQVGSCLRDDLTLRQQATLLFYNGPLSYLNAARAY